MEIGISEFKAKCIGLIKATAESGEELTITLRGRPMVRVVGIGQESERVLGGQQQALDDRSTDEALIRSDLEDDWDK